MLLAGLRVVEMSIWVAAPAAGGLMADWGADVVKIEPPTGDPMRVFYQVLAGIPLPTCPGFEMDNRGKRSLVIDLRKPGGPEAVAQLVDGADVFLTNYRHDALAKFGLSYETLSARNPRLVYAHLTGYGQEGPDFARAAYDVGAFWARSGIMHLLSDVGCEPAPSRAGFGDHTTGSHCLAGILAALYARERTGRGDKIDACLLRSGIYTIGTDIAQELAYGGAVQNAPRNAVASPTIACYRAGDGKWVQMLGVEADRHWPRLCRALERPELLDDPRFATPVARREQARELIAIFDAQFAKRPLAEWTARFDAEDVWWAPVNTPADLLCDPQVLATGAIVDQPDGRGSTQRNVAGPVRFASSDVSPRAHAPSLGEHTASVLREAGFSDADLAALRQSGAISI